ncbi:hypothetical protein OH76DRAFT_1408721 [Lentinus brumalis]|uniref:Secreted protein n=1 Tax=Lentinus brumalis TaxID=2498619 RepID=A0A371CWZ4_9APHY|nr:hypothetical protein OH76DRAFT_1408721 [Polyporus brumalis]
MTASPTRSLSSVCLPISLSAFCSVSYHTGCSTSWTLDRYTCLRGDSLYPRTSASAKLARNMRTQSCVYEL